MRNFFKIGIVICFIFGIKLYGQAIEGIGDQDQKIYFSADHVTICENTLVAFLENTDGTYIEITVPQINCDESGLFVWASLIPIPYAVERCPKFHPIICPRCFGCGVSNCPYRCKC